MLNIMSQNRLLTVLLISLTLVGCGGGGGSTSNAAASPSPSPSPSQGSSSGWVRGQYEAWRNLAGICSNPQSYSDVQGTTTDENFWIRSFSNDTYLWYRDLPDIDPGSINSTEVYFDLMNLE